MLPILSFIVVLGVIVFVHELGHFLAAKLMKVRVETFSLGFPPKLIGKKIGETEYMISLIPLGGYVKMAGMVDEALDKSPLTGASDEFMSKKPLQKVLVISAGTLMNIVTAFFLYTGIIFFSGMGEVGPAIIGSVETGMPADSAGIQPGDRIVEINGKPIADWEEMAVTIHALPDTEIALVWLRDTVQFSAKIRTTSHKWIDRGEEKTVGLIGIGPQLQMRPASLPEAVVQGGRATFFIAASTVMALKMVFTGQTSINDFVGPVGIVHYSGETAKSGLATFIGFIALISVNIGLLNLLPIPALDGGHLVYIAIEAIIRRPISSKVKLIIQQVGMALLLLFLLLISYNDIMRFFVK